MASLCLSCCLFCVSVHGFTLSLLLLGLCLCLSSNCIISALYSVIAWVKWCFHMQCGLIFPPSALNLVVAFFQPGRRHLLPVRPRHITVTNLRVKKMGVVSTSQVS